MRPLVSVVVPTYNRAHVIVRALDSVLRQNDVDLELVVVDDASTDNTSAVLQQVTDHRVEVVTHEVNSGGGVSRNTGLERSRGRYVAFLDSDDLWLPGALAQAIRTIRTSGTTLLISSFVVRRGRRLAKVTPGACVDASFSSLLRLRAGPFTTSCFVLDRKRAPLATFSPDLPALQDLDFALRLAESGQQLLGSRAVQTLKGQQNQRTYNPATAVDARLLLLDRLRHHLHEDAVACDAHHRALMATLVVGERTDATRAWLDGPARRALRGNGRWLRAAYTLGSRVGDAGVTLSYGVQSRPLARRLRDRVEGLTGARG